MEDKKVTISNEQERIDLNEFVDEAMSYLYRDKEIFNNLINSFKKKHPPTLVYFESETKKPFVTFSSSTFQASVLKNSRRWVEVYERSSWGPIFWIELRVNFPNPYQINDFTNGLVIENYFFIFQSPDRALYIPYRDLVSLQSDFQNQSISSSNFKILY